MKKLSINEAEALADKVRTQVGINLNEPINVKTLMRKLGVTTMYRPYLKTHTVSVVSQ